MLHPKSLQLLSLTFIKMLVCSNTLFSVVERVLKQYGLVGVVVHGGDIVWNSIGGTHRR
jgi:hypothetical protein